jgi:hypothetical protein
LYWSLLGSCCSLQAVGGSAVHAAMLSAGPSERAF